MNSVFLKQQIDHIREDGYTTIANPEFAIEIMAALPRPEFSEIEYVGGVGRMATDGYIFLPRAKQEIIAQIESELDELNRWSNSYRAALTSLSSSQNQISTLAALKELREAISDFKGHGMPGFTDRAQAYIVMDQADQVLKREGAV